LKRSEQISRLEAPPPEQTDPDFLLNGLCAELESYLDARQIAEVRRAHEFSARAHQGQRRLSGEPYISHPLSVARIVAGMHMNTESIVAAILHDVIEDTPTAKEQIAELFGAEVAYLVDGVSKLTQISFESRREAQAENFRKMLLAMVQDIRVIIIKLADRLHNMRTIAACPAEARRRIAHETLEIYAPIANRLGMNRIRTELQELGFAVYCPLRYRVLAESVRKARGNRREIVSKIKSSLEERFGHEGLSCRVVGREKNLYSLYEKMRTKRLSFSEVFDVYAFRIIVDNVDSCYRALGVVHNLYKPVPGKFKDYIAIPKANGYQSIHTVLFGPFGVHLEVQIRSEDMEKVAEAGVAAHWLYKLGDSVAASSGTQSRVREWMSGLLEMQKNAGNSLEFLENVKIDLFPDEVYVFTPRGKIMELPRGATPVDFAYAVHTDVGNTCVAAKIDRRLAPLASTLQSGQTVEIITAPGARPNPAWLNWVVTGKARATIRNYLKNLKREESIELGRRLLDQALTGGYARQLSQLEPGEIGLLLEEFKCQKIEQLFEEIGLGNRLAPLVARRLHEAAEEGPMPARRHRKIKRVFSRYMPSWLGGAPRSAARPLAIKGTEGMVVTFAKCCYPIPGDAIQGFVSSGRGVVVHAESCKNVKEFRNQPEKWIDVQWEPDIKGEFPVEIRVDVLNRRGVLATIAAAIAGMDVNINNVSIEEHDGKYSTISFVVAVQNRVHLARVMRRIRTIEHVVRIYRKKA
jgi:RelA/SpoT family (p)ppGpp synthetase